MASLQSRLAGMRGRLRGPGHPPSEWVAWRGRRKPHRNSGDAEDAYRKDPPQNLKGKIQYVE